MPVEEARAEETPYGRHVRSEGRFVGGVTRGMLRAAASAMTLCALAAGCGGGRPAPRAPAPASPPPTLSAECGVPGHAGVRPLWLEASDGQRLYAAGGGSGTVGVVLVPESPPGSICGWLAILPTLERAGRLRVLALDYRGTGGSPVEPGRARFAYGRDLAAAVGRLRAEGAKKVILMGASLGGAMAMAYGPDLDVDAVISLSGETSLPSYHVDAIDAVPRLRTPLLIVGTRHDTYLPVGDARRILARAGGGDEQAILLPGSWHGWEIVENAPYAQRALRRIIGWIAAHGFR